MGFVRKAKKVGKKAAGKSKKVGKKAVKKSKKVATKTSQRIEYRADSDEWAPDDYVWEVQMGMRKPNPHLDEKYGVVWETVAPEEVKKKQKKKKRKKDVAD